MNRLGKYLLADARFAQHQYRGVGRCDEVRLIESRPQRSTVTDEPALGPAGPLSDWFERSRLRA